MSKQWDKHVHDQLRDFSVKAPQGLFDDIRSEMHRRGLASVPTRQKRWLSSAVLFKVSAASFLLLLVGISFLWKEKLDNTNMHKPIVSPSEVMLPPIIEEPEFPVEQPITPMPNKLIAKAEKETPVQADTILVKEEDIVEEKDTLSNGNKQPQPLEKTTDQVRQQRKQTYNLSSKKKTAFAVSVYYSGIVTNEGGGFLLFGNVNRNDGEYYLSSPGPNQNGAGANDSTNASPESRMHSRTAFKEKEKHRLPIKFGVSFRYNLDEHWNIQSGLTYTYLVSDLNRYNSEASYNTKQKLHYIGIPLQVGYKLWESKRFRAYTSAGGQVERLIGGEASTAHFAKDKYQDTSIRHVSDNRLLFSVLGSIGAEYALGKSVSLYAEPGIHYHFKNGSPLKTYYTDHPLNFSITLGLRLHWNKE